MIPNLTLKLFSREYENERSILKFRYKDISILKGVLEAKFPLISKDKQKDYQNSTNNPELQMIDLTDHCICFYTCR